MKNSYKNREIEVRFLDINSKQIIFILKKLKAENLGESLIREIIFYDNKLLWRKQNKFVRLRKVKNKLFLTYKHHQKETVDGALEIELEVNNFDKAKTFLENLGLISFREQEKKRHSFKLDDTIIDIDTWPSIPTYLEIEGRLKKDLKETARKIGLDWSKGTFLDARRIIEQHYKVPVSKFKYFTFKKIK